MTTYAVRFDFPIDSPPLYSGIHKGASGFAQTLRTAELFDNPDTAVNALRLGYPASLAQFGRVIVVSDGGVPDGV